MSGSGASDSYVAVIEKSPRSHGHRGRRGRAGKGGVCEQPPVGASLSKVAQGAFYGVSVARYQGERELIREAKRIAAYRASVAAENARDTAIRQANAQIVAAEAARVAEREAHKSLFDRALGAVSVGVDHASAVVSNAWDRGSTWVQYEAQVAWRRARDPLQALRDDSSLTSIAENATGSFQILAGAAELYNEGKYCGDAGECLIGDGVFQPHDSDGGPMAITIGHTVTFGEITRPSKGLVEHEFTHVLQYEIAGALPFAIDYGIEQVWGVVVQHETKEDAYWNQSTERWARYVQEDADIEPGKNPLGHWFETSGS